MARVLSQLHNITAAIGRLIGSINTSNPHPAYIRIFEKSIFLEMGAWKRLGFDGKVLGDGSRTISEKVGKCQKLAGSDVKEIPERPQSDPKVTSKWPQTEPKPTPNRPQTMDISMDISIRLGISDGWSGFLGRLFQTRSVMGRLWDDHFRDLGHPPKFYRVQDAGFIGGSSI